MKPIIEVRGLYKEYRRGAQKEKYLSLRDQVSRAFRPGGKKETFNALEDINFKVYPGDSLAIIGKNGAGKSTLLKILSKITPPTKGEIIIRGRLASLLEVGTGFHPELTGRENIYLNGSILGLRRAEINRQFDAIVDFSGVSAFLDTPLKHYSSGMQLRLAFAVASHLEPEILVIDEVLAVGDSAFQKKCIDKMTEVSRSGRTILFVSHNLQAVKNLCSYGIILESGILKNVGAVETIIDYYLALEHSSIAEGEIKMNQLKRMECTGHLIFDTVASNAWRHYPESDIRLAIKLKTILPNDYHDILFGVNIMDRDDQCVYHLSNIFINQDIPIHKDEHIYTFHIPKSRLKPGFYTVRFFVRANEEIQDWTANGITMEVLEGNVYGFNNSKMISGRVQPDFLFNYGANI